MTSDPRGGGAVRQMHLALRLPGFGGGRDGPGEGAGDVCGDAPGVDFDAYVRLARAAERGLFDFLLVVESADGRGPEPLTVLNALAGVTEHIGLVAAVSTAGREPRQLVRRFAALDQLSAGRAGGPAAVVSRLGVPHSSRSSPVVIQEDADPAAEVVLAAARGRTRPGVKVLAGFEFTLTGEADPGASPEDDPAYALADRLEGPVRSGALDGYVLVPDAAAHGRGLDAFVERVVPLLQGRGSLRTAYRGTTLRDHLGLRWPIR